MLPRVKTSFKVCWPGGIVLPVISFALMSMSWRKQFTESLSKDMLISPLAVSQEREQPYLLSFCWSVKWKMNCSNNANYDLYLFFFWY